MQNLKSYADSRLVVGCIHCGGKEEGRDHVPSKILLDEPFPENLPVVDSCTACNLSFSKDEEYFATVLACVIAGTTDPEQVGRPAIAAVLRNSLPLRSRIEATRRVLEGQVVFEIEHLRVRNVLLKLARCHAAYELSQSCRHQPIEMWWLPLNQLTERDRESFDADELNMWGEVGSRQMQRVLVTQLTLRNERGETRTVEFFTDNWVEVQEGRYRYLAIDAGSRITIRIVLSEYLACEVTWET